ncbi:MAG: cytochrome c [Gemmatimonadota bacterium]|nr:cytochrome c [Gemmatimonadota bacterium]
MSSPLSLLARVILVGSALGFATACAHGDAAKTDTTVVASADSATTATTRAAAAQSASPVESVSTGETTISAESKANPSIAATNVTTGEAKVTAKPSAPAASTTPHKVRTVAHPVSATAAKPEAAPAAAPAAASDTGQKAAKTDSSKKAAAATTDTSKTASAANATDHLLVSPQEYQGWKMFAVYCYRCHGVDAMGGGIAPNLRQSVSSEGRVTHDVFIPTVTYGRTALGMPAWRELLSPEQIEDLWLYITARSTNRLYPGRPHMAGGVNP